MRIYCIYLCPVTNIYITDTEAEGQRMTKGSAYKMFMQDGEEGWPQNITIQCQFWGAVKCVLCLY